MNFLVTGAAGFLGSALANRLAREGHQVRGYDDLSAGDPSRLSADVLFTRGDVTDRPKLWTLLQEVDCVYHLAAKVSVPESILYPREYNIINVGGTVSVMEAMRDVGVRRVILISSGAIYGDQGQQPLVEDALPNPGSPYAVSKLAAEHYVHTIGALWGIETVALRVFNAYGPGQPLAAAHPPVVPHFLRQVAHGGSVVIHGKGEQTRDFVYLEDVVEAMIAAASAPTINRSVINIGSGTETSIKALGQSVLEAVGVKSEWIYKEDQDAGPSRMCADIQLAREKLGYRPRFSLQKGLALMISKDSRFRRDPPSG
ncbi:MAG: NAD-dependent epimerase/dehydratase family protein [Anaerolineales bacterium]|jgi:UDP-glucose 4-epimerase|nr:NAD-dependent epimerase/dehydratase family protein [Anaerolineales bacterium]